MLTKQEFVDAIKFIKQQHEKEDKLHEALRDIAPDIQGDFIFAEFEDKFVTLLKKAMELPEINDDIGYFIYELNFGVNYKPGMITENGYDIDFSSAEAVYDYIVRKKADENID